MLILTLFFVACTEPKEEKPKEIKWSTDHSTQMNKDFAIEEELRIKMYLADRPKWKTVKTGTGLRYFIYAEGKGAKAEAEMTAEVTYSISLLNGDLCYKTDTLETETFKIDHSDIESGVQEGIKKMKVGDKAKLIVPSHLAYGITGDNAKIPPLQALVIDLELISLKK